MFFLKPKTESTKKSIIFVLAAGFIGLAAHTSLGQSANPGAAVSIGEVHDYFMQAFCDSVAHWRNTRKPVNAEEAARSIWNMMYEGLPEKLGITQQELDRILAQLGINERNFTNAPTFMYEALDPTRKSFVDDLLATFTANFDLPDKQLIQVIRAKKQDWIKRLPEQEIDYAIEVAVSSMIYWKNNVEDCILGSTALRTDRKKEAAKLAAGDVTGAAWGGLTGGPAGALVGAVGGTLGASIGLLIDHWW
ncbi:MAG: hypothetical protein D6794_00580 [Deltaproteobacteria bacterium]|nr:MAG: hypothetical protein D6794_00580 [Deltaproteobacteria bacterium]